MNTLLSALELVTPLIKYRVHFHAKGAHNLTFLSNFITLYNLVPKDVTFILSTQPDVFGTLGDPRMAIDNNREDILHLKLTGPLACTDIYAALDLVSLARAGVLHGDLVANWCFFVAAWTNSRRDLGSAYGLTNLIVSVPEYIERCLSFIVIDTELTSVEPVGVRKRAAKL